MKKKNAYYAIFEGPRVDEPTIFTSWGAAHPYVTGCTTDHMGHPTLKEAKEWLHGKGVHHEPRLVGPATAVRSSKTRNGFYAVAYGTNVGIHNSYDGENGAKREVEKVGHACHKHFRTKEQAEAFINDWTESVADIYRQEIKKELDARNVKPPCLSSKVARLFDTPPWEAKKEEEEEDEGEGDDARASAETLSEAWKICLADMYRAEIKKQLDKGARPHDLNFDVSCLFQASPSDAEDCHGVGSLKFNELSIL